ncbi:MAG: PDZ domain-containing protein [Anaerolineaceae bacterium]|nr:PDZ domain-containing protein [Anaerolineaceae bacterium]
MNARTWKSTVAVSLFVAATLVAWPVVARGDDSEAMTQLQLRIEKVAAEVGRCVVSVQNKGKAPQVSMDRNFDPWDMLPPEWRRRFPQRPRSPQEPRRKQPQELVPRGLGSGVIISPDGYILTNQHVIRGAEEVEVTLSDKRHFKAKIIGQDPRSDLAVLKIEADGLPAAKLDGDVEVRRGLFVLAMGTPFGFGADGQASISFGIVSGTRRRLALGQEEDRFYGKLIQTDAAINPGNSGGPLCDLKGRVIGINVAIASRGGGSQGVGFAIPIDETTRDIIRRLKKGKKIEYGYLGVEIRNPKPIESKTAGAEPGIGAFVSKVVPDSPAAKAGLLPADLIIEIDGKRITDADDLVGRVGLTPVGGKIKLTLYRSGKKMTLWSAATWAGWPPPMTTARPGRPPRARSSGGAWSFAN